MKYLLLLSTLTLSLMFSSASSAEWTSMGETVAGTTYYIDLDRVRKNGGYTYFWYLNNLIKPDDYGHSSNKFYTEVDCKAFRHRTLTYIYYKQPMGEGEGESQTSQNQEWRYPPPDSMSESMLNKVCAQIH